MSEKTSMDISHHYNNHKFSKWKRFKNSLLVFGLLNLIWLIFRTGSKPTRIVYPCQQLAIKNISLSFGAILPILSLAAFFYKSRDKVAKSKTILLLVLLLLPLVGGVVFQSTHSVNEVGLLIEPKEANSVINSDIFIVNGRDVAHISNLIDVMGNNGLNFYYSETATSNQGPDGLIASEDVILLKINCQWPKRGGTNTDMLKELIEVIIAHPDGFTGEIVVADNGQGRGSMDWSQTNAENHKFSSQDVVNYFSGEKISTYLWDDIRGTAVDEFSEGDNNDGYIVYEEPDPETGIFISYPKFKTIYGTKISFKNGIWNGTHYENKLKVINLPVLKSHGSYGVTGALKHYMGVQTQQLANGHQKIATGGMGTLMAEFGLPILNIMDAIWINANPAISLANGPSTGYSDATRVNILMASLDPVALDYWAAKNILVKTAEMIGYSDTHTLSPDNSIRSGLTEAFGVWLNKTEEELVREGYNVTSNENNINIYANSMIVQIESYTESNFIFWLSVFGTSVLSLIIVSIIYIKKLKK
ncbi:MAG: DUF362 domain-containing protein [Candidatus Thorarchaeota archaeon]